MPSYNGTSTITPWSISSDYRVAALQGDLYNNQLHVWLNLGVSYSFPNGPTYFNNGTSYGSQNEIGVGWAPLTAAEQATTRSVLAAWMAVSNLYFVEVDDDLIVGDMRFAITGAVPSTRYGHAYPPRPNSPESGDVWLTSVWAGSDFGSAPSQTSGAAFQHTPTTAIKYQTLMHEVGHALGLSHPHTEADKTRYTAPLPVMEDSLKTTVMSYAPWTGQLGAPDRGIPTTPMVYDILAIQQMYGANMTHNSGSTTYRFDVSDTRLETIWDAGGVDTIVATNRSGLVKWDTYFPIIGQVSGHRGVQIDLRPAQGINPLEKGLFGGQNGTMIGSVGSYAATAFVNEGSPGTLTFGLTYLNALTNIYIAFDTWIENAVGTDGNDKLVGNLLNNRLTGAGGSDRFDGLEGIDTAVYTETAASHSVVKTASGFDVTANFTVTLATPVGYGGTSIGPFRAVDKLQNIERIEFSDRSLAFDMATNQSAGKAARIIGALLDTSRLTPDVAGIGIGLFDSGKSMLDVAQLILNHPVFLQVAGSASNSALVNLLFNNIAGAAPSASELSVYSGLLDRGDMSRAQLAVTAAESSFNEANINLVGLQTNGLAFTPALG
ncbi:MAG: M10 family metallopeptidase C-terminal domain-containing protein [Pseudomonadota bacterium]